MSEEKLLDINIQEQTRLIELYDMKKFKIDCCGSDNQMEITGMLSRRCVKCNKENFYCKKCYDESKEVEKMKLEQDNNKINKWHISVGKQKHTNMKGYYCINSHGTLIRYSYDYKINEWLICDDIP